MVESCRDPVRIQWECCLNPAPEPTMFRPLQCVSPTKNLLRIGIPLGALIEKSWIPKLDRCAMVGEAQASDWPLPNSYRNPVGIMTEPCGKPV
jgi:hypothetical protein